MSSLRINDNYTMHAKLFDELTPRELFGILKVRSLVFLGDQGITDQDIDDRDCLASTTHLWVADELTKPVATLRLMVETDEDTLRIGRVATLAQVRSQGLAGDLIRYTLQLAAGKKIVLGAQLHLKQWYEKFGFVASGKKYNDAGIAHISMSLISQK
jgi:ElaA protein